MKPRTTSNPNPSRPADSRSLIAASGTGFSCAFRRGPRCFASARLRRSLDRARRERRERANARRADAHAFEDSGPAAVEAKMATMCAHAGASVAGKAVVSARARISKAVGRSAAMPARVSAAGATPRAASMAGVRHGAGGVAHARGVRRGKVRARFRPDIPSHDNRFFQRRIRGSRVKFPPRRASADAVPPFRPPSR